MKPLLRAHESPIPAKTRVVPHYNTYLRTIE